MNADSQPDFPQTRSMNLAVMLIALLLPLLWATAHAGTGSIDTTAKTIDLNALFTYQEATDKLKGSAVDPTWEKVFNEASKRLWNATNGQLRIGKIKAYLRALSKKDNADVWIAKNAGGAYATGLAKLGVRGDHMQFYGGTHRSLSGYKGDFSIVHEMGHYVFGAYDEYLGTWVPFAKKDNWTAADFHGWISNNPNIYSVAADSSIASIMDGGGGVSPANNRTEFDTAGNVVKGVRSGNRWYLTKQWAMYKKSVWETMADFEWGGVKVFPTVPAGDSPTDMPAGYADIEFEVIPTLNRLVLTVDHSGSMSSDSKLELAKLGANIFVSLAEEKHSIKLFEGTVDEETIVIDPDNLGVVQFDSGVATIFPMAEVDAGGTIKTAARAAIDGISLGGATAVWDAAQHSLGMIQGQGDKVSGEVVILLTDGQDNSSSTSAGAVAADAKTREAKIYTIGLGSDVEAGALSSLALATGGKYYQATDGLALMSIYAKIYSELKGGGLLDAVGSLLHESEQASHTVKVDELTEEVTFAITSPDEGWTFSIVAPDGTEYKTSDAAEGVVFENNGHAQHYRVTTPQVGTWSLKVTAPAGIPGASYQYNVLTSASSPNVELTAATDQESYTYPQPILVKAKLTAGDPVAGAELTADVSGPNGALGKLTLYDDGLALHGDDEANDGQYSAYYRGLQADGVYTFEITANNRNGFQGIALPEKTDTAFVPKAIPAFSRTSTVSAEVSDVPEIDQSWLRVDALTAKRNAEGIGTVNLAMSLNNVGLDADQLSGAAAIADDLTVSIGFTGKTIAATGFHKVGKVGKQPGVFVIRPEDPKDKTFSGSLRADIGGSSRSQLNLALKQLDLSGLSLTGELETVNVRVQWGDFDQTVSLNAVVQGENKLAYLAKKNFANTAELYINGMKADVQLKKTNADALRLVANFSGAAGAYAPETDALKVELGGFSLDIPAGTLTAKGKSGISKGEVVHGSGKIKVTVDSGKRLITLRGSKISLAGAMSDTMVAGLDVGLFFTDKNLLVASHKANKSVESFGY